MGGGDSISLNQFLHAVLYNKYKPLSLEELIDFMKSHDDMYVVTDKLFTDAKPEKIIQQIISFSESKDAVLDRFIIQVYDEKNFFLIDALHHFKNYIYTTYCENEERIYKTAVFCIKNNIPVITMWHERAQKADITLLTEKGLHIYTHTVNTQEEYEQDKDLGITGVYTDFLIPNNTR